MDSSSESEYVRVSISLPSDLLSELDAIRGGLPRSRVVSKLIQKFVDERGAGRPEDHGKEVA